MKEVLSERLAHIQEVEPDIIDKAMLAEAQDVNDGSAIDMEKVKTIMEFSGKLNIRIPRSLHCQLSREAHRDGVSLNQYIIYKLAR